MLLHPNFDLRGIMPKTAFSDRVKTTYRGNQFNKMKRYRSMTPKPILDDDEERAVSRLIDAKLAKEADRGYHDISGSPYMVVAGSNYSLCNIAQGDNHANRTGDSITPHYVSLRFRLEGNTAGTFKGQTWRIIVYQSIGNGTALTATQLLADFDDPLSFYNPQYVGSQARILGDLRGIVTNYEESGDYMQYAELNIPKYKLKNITFDGTSSGATRSNGLHMFLMSSEATYGPTCTYVARLGYSM